MLRARWWRGWTPWRGLRADRQFRLIETSGFGALRGSLQGFNFGQETVAAQTSLAVRWHRDFWQFRAPAAGFLLAGHCGAALCAEFFHQVMMAQLWGGVQRCEI